MIILSHYVKATRSNKRDNSVTKWWEPTPKAETFAHFVSWPTEVLKQIHAHVRAALESIILRGRNGATGYVYIKSAAKLANKHT